MGFRPCLSENSLPFNSEGQLSLLVKFFQLAVFSFSTLNILCHSHLACKVSAENLLIVLTVVPLYLTNFLFQQCHHNVYQWCSLHSSFLEYSGLPCVDFHFISQIIKVFSHDFLTLSFSGTLLMHIFAHLMVSHKAFTQLTFSSDQMPFTALP